MGLRATVVLEKTGPLNNRVQKKPRGKTFVAHVEKMIPRRQTESEERESVIKPEGLGIKDDAPCSTERAGDAPYLRSLRPHQALRKPTRFAD